MKNHVTIFSNGFTLIYIPFRGYKTVYLNLTNRNGSASDPLGKFGIAHFAEHMLADKAMRHLRSFPGGEHIAVDFEAKTLDRRTEYVCSGHNSKVKLALEAMAKCADCSFDENDFLVEKKRIKNEILAEQQTAYGTHRINVRKSIFGKTGYGHEAFGSTSSVAGIGFSELTAYVKNSYTGKNLVLTVVGDLNWKKLQDDVHQLFGKLPTGVVSLPAVPLHKPTKKISDKKGIRRCSIAWIAPPHELGENALLTALLDGYQVFINEIIKNKLGLYELNVSMIRYPNFTYLEINGEVASGIVNKFLSACESSVIEYPQRLTETEIERHLEAVIINMDLEQDSVFQTGSSASWHFVTFGEAVTSDDLLKKTRRNADLRHAKGLFARMFKLKPCVVVT